MGRYDPQGAASGGLFWMEFAEFYEVGGPRRGVAFGRRYALSPVQFQSQHFGSVFVCQVLASWTRIPGVDLVRPTLMVPQQSFNLAKDPVSVGTHRPAGVRPGSCLPPRPPSSLPCMPRLIARCSLRA